MTIMSFLLVASLFAPTARAGPDDRTMHKYIQMRDGVKLHTRITFPRDFDQSGGQKAVAVMDRSPYGQFGIELLADLFVPVGFVSITQDMRGTGESGGHFNDWQSDKNDSVDTGNWLVSQNYSNGQIFSFGASADGLGAFTTNYDSPSWLYSQYYIWTSSIGYDCMYPNGAQLYNLLNRWISGTVREIDYDEAMGQFLVNEARTSWWDVLDFTNDYGLVKQGQFGFWAGWYDIFLVGTLAAYNGYNTQSADAVRYNSVLTIDPCGHCQDAAQYFPQNLVFGRSLLPLMQAYETYGIRPVKRPHVKNVTFYVMSSNDEAGLSVGNFWTTMERFPEPTYTNMYLHSDGVLSSETNTADEKENYKEYTYDPSNTQPTRGGNNLFSDAPCGPLDNQENDQREDVLVFQTTPYSSAMYLTGAINAYLHVASDAVDTDFMVRLADVYPTGEARLIQDSAARMRWRNGGTTPQYLSQNLEDVYSVNLTLWNTSFVVAPGHSLRVSISSSNYPRFSINNNNGILLADPTYPGPNITAKNRVIFSANKPSYISIPVVESAQLPKYTLIKEEFMAAYPQVDITKALNWQDKMPKIN